MRSQLLNKINLSRFKILYYQSKIVLNANNYHAYYKLGRLFSDQERWLDATNSYQQAIKLNYPNLSQVYYLLAKVLIQLDYLEEAIVACRHAIDLNPDIFKPYFYLGEIFVRQKRWLEAIENIKKAIQLNPNYFWSYYHLGITLTKLEKWQEAATTLQYAVDLNPSHYDSYEQLLKSLNYLRDANNPESQIADNILTYQTLNKKLIAATHPHFSPPPDGKHLSCYPNFLIIGQQKCGTTSLYSYLVKHPQILPSIQKEVHFWNNNFNLGLDWYLAHFPSIATTQDFITGEASASYLNSPEIAKNIAKFFPNIKLIVLLRNPVERTISHYYMACRVGNEERSLEEAIFSKNQSITQKSAINSTTYLDDNHYLAGSRYFDLISQWMDVFPREQFLIIKSEDLFTNPTSIVNQVFQFLGVKSHHITEYKKINSGSYSSISESQIQVLRDYFRPHNQKLEEYLGMNFNWY